MRKLRFAYCALALGLISGYASADSQGTVTFNGKLIAETCEIDTNDVDKTVTLPTISTQTFAKAGDEAGSTTFTIKAVSCPAAITKVAAHFEALDSTGFDPVTGNLTNAAATGGAKNVEVRLYNTDSSVIAVGETGAAFDVQSDQTALMRYIGGYYATAATEAGDVTAKVNYTLSYP
ncbi:type 1 fimbrial protein [Cronobacter sakazakii]|uniref:Type 1 fimbrial protein n=1 Tax=Cronobacter sakazakii TaxID=28141 RepID=A0A853HFP4_CROSK|nr:fimbrial protein [Cronobacter sakazakii]NYV43584.1 type 1 fimbrial protein [Cronobacter sakazakii]